MKTLEKSDHRTQVMDAMCLVEAVYWGECERAYSALWNKGIYEFRDRVAQLAKFAHEAWQLSCYEADGDKDGAVIDFDTEWCPAWLYKWMISGCLNSSNIYDDEWVSVNARRFAQSVGWEYNK